MAPVSRPIDVLWGDMDALGHVNNTRYFVWFEHARIALFEAVGLDASRPDGVGPILATTSADFLRPVVYPARLEVLAWVSRVGTTSFGVDYRIDAPDGPVARGTSVVVLVDYTRGGKVPLDDALRARLAERGP